VEYESGWCCGTYRLREDGWLHSAELHQLKQKRKSRTTGAVQSGSAINLQTPIRERECHVK